jgi:hypothetical protein
VVHEGGDDGLGSDFLLLADGQGDGRLALTRSLFC